MAANKIFSETIFRSKTSGNVPASHQGLPAQDYEQIKAQCRALNKLFEDPFFQLDDSFVRSHLLKNHPPITETHEWKRPKDIVDAPQFVIDGFTPSDIDQGLVGDCWVLAAIGSLALDPALFNQVVPPNQGFDDGYCGIFRFRFWYFGEWVDIVVDDRLPCIPKFVNPLLFLQSKDPNEFWCALFEKAYAKLYGGYKNIEGGECGEAMEDFTGGVVQPFDLTQNNPGLFERIDRTLQLHTSLLTCSIQTGNKMAERNGLVTGHAYTIVGAETVKAKATDVHLLSIRNPWAKEKWTGDWNDGSDKWSLVPANTKDRLLKVSRSDDGVFWISYEDFCKNFTNFELGSAIEHLNSDTSTKIWSVLLNKSGSWLNSNHTAGGCINNPASFVTNPQFVVELGDSGDGDGKCLCTIALTQKYRRRMGLKELPIGIMLYHAPADGSRVLTVDYVRHHEHAASSDRFVNLRDVLLTARLDPGKYIIVPSTFDPGHEADFLLRVFSESKQV
ncbi:hypothetical protein EMCRGX_G024135 [Ephydatia muelleri]